MTAADLDAHLDTLRRHGVTHYKSPDMEVTFGAAPVVAPAPATGPVSPPPPLADRSLGDHVCECGHSIEIEHATNGWPLCDRGCPQHVCMKTKPPAEG